MDEHGGLGGLLSGALSFSEELPMQSQDAITLRQTQWKHKQLVTASMYGRG
jgi:hypothetical protein